MRVLVTGGLGFIGSNFVRYVLRNRDWEVTNLDKQTYSGNPENLRDVEKNPRYRWVREEITDAETVRRLMSHADVVVHFAAETHVDRSILDSQAFLKTNVMGTHCLLEAARHSSVKLFLHVSTDEVYGSVEKGESLENDPLLPNSPYAASKAASDLVARSYNVTYGLPVIITRCSNNFGPYQYPEKALPLLITNAIDDQSFPLYGDGRHVRDWIYVLDHVKALVLLVEKGTPGEIYNIGGTFSLSNREMVSLVLGHMNKPESLIQKVADRPGHDRRYALHCGKLKSLGWSAQTTFDTALKETLDWYGSHENWWRPLKKGAGFSGYYQQQYARRLEKTEP